MPQYEQNLTEQFGSEKLSVGWPWRLFVFSLVLLAISLITYVGILFGYKPFLQNQIELKDKEINRLADTVSKTDQEQLTKFYSQLLNLKSILDQHIVTNKILPFLEKNTNKSVFYTKLSAKAGDYSLTLEGFADSFEILAQQLEAFRQAKEVNRFIINESQLVEGRVRFKLTAFLMPTMFKQWRLPLKDL